MSIEQIRSLIGTIYKDPANAPDGKYDQPSQDKTSVVADMYNLGFKEKKMLAEVSHRTHYSPDIYDNHGQLHISSFVLCWVQRDCVNRNASPAINPY